MTKKQSKETSIYTYEVIMLVHIISDDAIEAKKKLDEEGGIVTKREVNFLNAQPLFGEKENK